MSKKSYKVIKILSIILVLIITAINVLNITVLGFDTSAYDPYKAQSSGPSEIETLLKNILGAVQVIAGFAAVISVIWLGISFMKESPQGRAESKKKVYMILIGALLIFGASKIVEVIADSASKLKT